ncbi:MAG: adenylate/guanylate cyclase domain-containing protein [Anaerolineales bacterium]
MFADLSGFSPMADALSRHGQAGAEALAEVMRVIFEPLVTAVYAQGGFVVGYAGDAFTAVFPEKDDGEPAIFRCLAAAQAIQRYTTEHPSVTTVFGRFPIFIKVGLGLGQVDWLILRSSDGRRATCCMRGACVDGAVEAEEQACAGDVVLSAAAYEALRIGVAVEPVNSCFRLLSLQLDLPPALPIDPLPDEMPGLQGVFYPQELDSLSDVGEFRQVVNLFIDIPIDPSNEAFVKPFMESVFDLQERYGGVFLRPDIGDKGFNLLIFWGAPVAHENDVERALGFMLELFERTGLQFRAGVTRLMAYAGFIGASLREDYTAYGWGVNLAARFMGMAQPGQVWLDEETARRAERRFLVRPLGEVEVKGFAEKQKAYLLLGRKETPEFVYRGALVGRQAELQRLAHFFAPLQQDKFCGVMLIAGQAGIGKSRLAHAFQSSEFFADLPVRWLLCQSDEVLRSSFGPFRAWLRERFGYRPGDSQRANLERFELALKRLMEKIPDASLIAELERTWSLLAALLNLSSPGSLYERLDAKGRYENIFLALAALLRAESLQSPVVLFIEDLQWLDEDTRAFLPYLARVFASSEERDYPFAILATSRPEVVPIEFEAGVPYQVLELAPLTVEHLNEMAQSLLGAPVGPGLLRLLEVRAEGNPFFAEQILQYLSENDFLYRRRNGRLEARKGALETLPLEVGTILVSRFDRLPRQVCAVVQTAAVLGREFELDVLARMLGNPPDLPEKVGRVEDAGIWFSLNSARYLFRHALLREAAYTMQLRARRRKLHAQAVAAIETVFDGQLTSHASELAYHAEQARMKEQACKYLILAGETVEGMYQNAQAVDYYTRALRVTPAQDWRARFDLLARREKIYDILGERASQHRDLLRLKDLAERLGDSTLLARFWMRYARYHYSVSEFSRVIQDANHAINLSLEAEEIEVLLETYTVWPLALLRLGRLQEAMQTAEQGLNLARQHNRRRQQGYLVNSAGLIALEQKNPTTALQYFEEARLIAQEMEDPDLEARALTNLANVAGFVLGDYLSAQKYYQQVYSLACERGKRSTQLILLSNLGWVSGMMGDFEVACSYHRQTLSLVRETGNRFMEVYPLLNLSAIMIAQGKAREALRYARQAHALAVDLNETSLQAWACFYQGYAALLGGETAYAVEMFQRSAAIRRAFDQPGLWVEAIAGLAQAALSNSDLSTAREHAETILALLENDRPEGMEEPLRVYWTIYQILERTKDPRANRILNIAGQLLTAQISRIADEAARRMYIENFPWRRALWQACAARPTVQSQLAGRLH